MMALEGVSKGALAKTIREVIRGAYGSEFLPAAPALRIMCDKNQRVVAEDIARDRVLRETIEENRRLAAPKLERDEAFRERQRKRMADFHAFMDTGKKDAENNTFDTAFSRLQALAAAHGKTFDLYGLPSSPSDYFKQVGKAA